MKLFPPSAEQVAAAIAAKLGGKTSALFASVKNSHGNFDGKKSLPAGLIEISGASNARIWGACRALGITHLQVLSGFSGSRKHGFKPDFNGAVVLASNWDRLARRLWPEWEARQASLEAWERVLERRAAERTFEPESEALYA